MREAAARRARRRTERRLRAYLRYAWMSVAMALAESTHHSAPRGQTTARARGWVRGEVHGEVPAEPTTQEPGTQHFKLDDDDSVPEIGGTRSGVDVNPQKGTRRHTGEAFELVLDPVVPQLGRDVRDLAPMLELYRLERSGRWGLGLFNWPEEEPVRGSRSSNKIAGRRKRKKRRKKKMPNLPPPPRAVDWMEHEYEGAATTEYVQRADVHIQTVDFYTLHAGPMNLVHSKEVTGYTGPGGAAPGMEEMHKFIEE